MINDNLLEIYALKNGESIVGITQQGINSLANKDFALRYKDTMSSISTFSNKFINQYIGLSEPFLKFRHNWMDKQAIRQISPRYQAYGFLPSALFYDRLGLNFIEVVTQIVSDQEFKYKIEQWCRLFDSTTNREPVLNYVYFFSPHKVMLINILNRLSLPEKYANRLIVFDIKEKLVPFNPVSPPQMAFQLQTVRTFEGPTLFYR
jgi:hypothetical protein